MASIEVNGASLAYSEQGGGDSVILVHGSASDSRTWDYQVDALSTEFRTIVYSRRYHRPNERIREGDRYALWPQVDDLERILRVLASVPAHLVGHSYGGLICLLLAARAPDLVTSLVLAEPPIVGFFVSVPPKPTEILRLALRRPRTAVGVVNLGGFGLARASAAFERGDARAAMEYLGNAILGRHAFRGLSEARTHQARENLIEEELLHEEAMPRLSSDLLRSISCPTLLVGGDQSPRVFARFLDHLEKELPHSQRVVVPGSSHLMHEDNAEHYNEAILNFLHRED